MDGEAQGIPKVPQAFVGGVPAIFHGTVHPDVHCASTLTEIRSL